MQRSNIMLSGFSSVEISHAFSICNLVFGWLAYINFSANHLCMDVYSMQVDKFV